MLLKIYINVPSLLKIVASPLEHYVDVKTLYLQMYKHFQIRVLTGWEVHRD